MELREYISTETPGFITLKQCLDGHPIITVLTVPVWDAGFGINSGRRVT